MEVLKIMVVVFGICLIIFFGAVFSIGAILDIIESVKLSKLRKTWAAEQEEARYQRKIKLSCCKTCKRKKNCTDYFGYPCIYNSEWLCEGPAAPERPITIEVKRAQDWARITRCKDCINWENNYCSTLKKPIYNPDWFCCSGMRKNGDK